MREILFRGKRVDNGEWVSGENILRTSGDEKECFIVPTGAPIAGFELGTIGQTMLMIPFFKVIPETVGQFTGFTDNNDEKIFEGDILEGLCGLHRVYFDEAFACFDWKNISGKLRESFSGFADDYEIIGNIHDNPELLKEGADNGNQ